MSSIFALPSYLWNSYVDYLWNYDSNSWVATVAYAFRIWAILAILPTLVLALLVSNHFLSQTNPALVRAADTLAFPICSLLHTGRNILCHSTHTRRPYRLYLSQILIRDAATPQVRLQNC